MLVVWERPDSEIQWWKFILGDRLMSLYSDQIPNNSKMDITAAFFIIYCNPNTLVTVTARGVGHVMLMQHFYVNVIHTFIKHGGAGSDDLGLFCSHRTWEPFQSLSLPWTHLECSREYSRVSCEPIYWTVKAWLELSDATEQWSQACHQICNRCVTCIRCKCVTEWLKKKRIKVPQWHLTRAAQI